MYKRILIAADGSPHSLRAAEQAMKLASCDSETLVEIVYVLDAASVKADVLHHWDDLDRTDLRKKRVIAVEENDCEMTRKMEFIIFKITNRAWN